MKAKTRDEQYFAFTDKTTGKKVSFEPVAGKYIVSFDETAVVQTTAEAEAVSTGMEIDWERGYRIMEFDASTTGALNQAEVLSQIEVPGTPEPINVLPAMRDADGYERFVVPDEFAVQFDESVESNTAEELLKEHGLRIKKRFQTPGFYLVAVPEGEGLFKTMETLAGEDAVAFVEPSEFSVDDQLDPTGDIVSEYETLWGLQNTGQKINGATGTPGMDVRALKAWAVTRGSPNVIIAVLDTGCQMDHPDIKPSLLARPEDESWNFVRPESGDTTDPHGHGTHVCGTCAAAGNGTGVIGLAPECKLMPLQVELRGSAADYQRRADAINLVRKRSTDANGAKRYTLNLSWKTNGDVISIRTAIEKAIEAGVVVVAAAGNDGSNMDVNRHYPVCYAGILAVAALDQQGKRWSGSNYGDRIDLSAPGVNIHSTVPRDSYSYKQGTSMAAPHVAAAAALLLSIRPNATVEQIHTALTSSARNVDELNPGYEGKLGYGMIDVSAALAMA